MRRLSAVARSAKVDSLIFLSHDPRSGAPPWLAATPSGHESRRPRQAFRIECERPNFKQLHRSDPGVLTFLVWRVDRGLSVIATSTMS
jgi:hypothetical protein